MLEAPPEVVVMGPAEGKCSLKRVDNEIPATVRHEDSKSDLVEETDLAEEGEMKNKAAGRHQGEERG